MRKSHRKSRNGCLQCKTRHIKCNEVQPKCANCSRLEIPCSFTAATPLLDHSVSPSQSPAAALVSNTTLPLNFLDLELYHHFVYDYHASLFIRKDVRDHLMELVMRLALRTDYLMHNLLALSALHLFQINPSRTELYERACYLQGVAIPQVQPVMANLTQEDSIAALMFSGHTTAFGLAEYMLNPNRATDPTDPIDKIVECFQLSRGVLVVVSPYWQYLKETWLNAVFHQVDDQRDIAKATLDTDFPTYRMLRSLAFGQEDPERRQICIRAIDEVFISMSVMAAEEEKIPTSTQFIDAWAVHLESAFKDMLSERKPVSLIILAHYAVLMSMNPRAWHLRDWPETLITRIDNILGPEWSEFLRWPKEKISGSESHLQTPRGMSGLVHSANHPPLQSSNNYLSPLNSTPVI